MAATKKRSTKKAAEQANTAKRQLLSVIWFAVSVFFLCVVFIKGQNLWLGLHNIIFGIFGVTAYFYPFLMGFVAIVYALDKIKGSFTAKMVEVSALAVLIGAAVDIFSSHPKIGFWEQLVKGYTDGVALKSGGFLGALIGEPIYLAFGKTGAAITVILLIFVLLMLVTGTTLIALFRSLSRPVKAVSKQAEEVYRERQEKEENGKKQLKVIKGFDPDIPVDDIPQKRRDKTENLSRKQAKVVSTYYDEPMPEEILETPEGCEDN